jgi:hypothetical protein
MADTTRAYAPKAVQVFLSPYRIQGFSGDTIVTVSPVTADDEHEVSVDGSAVVLNVSSDNRHIVTMTLHPESTGYKYLAEIRAEQRTEVEEGGALTARAFRLTDPSNGDTWESDHAIIISRPDVSMGSGRDGVEFRVLLPDPTVSLATAL